MSGPTSSLLDKSVWSVTYCGGEWGGLLWAGIELPLTQHTRAQLLLPEAIITWSHHCHVNKAKNMISVIPFKKWWTTSDGQSPTQGSMTMAVPMWTYGVMWAASSLKAFEVLVSVNNIGKVSTGRLPIWLGDLTLTWLQVCFPLSQQMFYCISFTPK